MEKQHDIALLITGLLLAGILQFIPAYPLTDGITANLALGFGFIIGILSGGLGMGGVWMMVPLMIFLFGIGIKAAIGTALTAQVVITLVGSYQHLREKHTGLRLSLPLIIGGFIGTPVGGYLNFIAPNVALNWTYSILLSIIAGKMIYEIAASSGNADRTEGRNLSKDILGEEQVDELKEKANKEIEAEAEALEEAGRKIEQTAPGGIDRTGPILEKLGGLSLAFRDRVPEEIKDDYHGSRYRADTLTLFLAGIVFGIVNSLLGTSTTIMLPFLDVFMQLNTHVASSVSLINVTAISIPASLSHIALGNVIFPLAATVSIGGIAGAIIGSDLNEIAPEEHLQKAILLLIIVMAYYMLPMKPF